MDPPQGDVVDLSEYRRRKASEASPLVELERREYLIRRPDGRLVIRMYEDDASHARDLLLACLTLAEKVVRLLPKR